MKRSNRVMALLLALVMVFTMLPVSVFADTVPTFTVSSVEGNPGDEVEVKVSISNNPGLDSMVFAIVYDETRLEKVSFTGGGMDGKGEWTYGETTNKVLWDNGSALSYNGEILTLKFKIKADAPLGDAAISIDEFDITDPKTDADITPNVVAGKVSVVSKPVTGITLDQTELSMTQGGTAALTATVQPEDAGNKKVNWSSSNEKVATVDNGVVTAVGAGSATITAKAGEFEATCAVTVAGANVPVTGITLDKSNFYLWSTDTYIMEGHSATMIANVTPDYATDKTVTWTSSDESVATVDANGVVNALQPGSTTITAASGEVSASCTITVIDLVFTATADDESVAIQYTGSSGTKPTSQCDYRIEIPAGTKTLKLSGPMTTDWSIPSALKDTLADGTMTIDLSTYGRSGDHWEITMVAKNGYYWGTCHVISIYMESCEGDHTFAAATCTAPATCTVCYATQGEALGHNLVETTAQVDAVCETPGTTAVMGCTRCDYTEGGTTIPAPGHTWKKIERTKEPTCTEDGEDRFMCTVGDCDAKKTEPVTKLGHTWNEGSVTKEPTCTEKGVKTFGCTVDGCDGSKTEEIPANGHSYVDGYCSVCEKMEPTEIPFTDANHTSNGNAFNQYLAGVDCLVVDGIAISDWTEWTGSMNKSITIYVDPVYKNAPVTISLKAKDGYTGTLGLFASPVTVNLSEGVGQYLARSNKIGIANFGCFVYFKLGECTGDHTWVEATCTEPKTCSVCGKTEGEALGHTWNEGTVTKDPTCDELGVKTFACTVDGCNGSKTEDVPVLGHLWGEGSICTRPGCRKSNTITEIAVSHPKIKKDEATGAMSMTMNTGASEKIDVSFGLVDAAVASTQFVAWSSSVEEVATVDNGTVTALKHGTTTITAKAVDASGTALVADGEDVLAEFTLTVADPEEGYTVIMGDDVMNTVIGSNVSIPVTIDHTGDVTKYNAFDLSFSYDPAILELTSTAIEGMTVDYLDENQQPTGNVHIERYGDDLTAGQTAFTLTFKAIATGETKVEVTSAKVDISESALTQNAPDASFIDELTRVSVTGYTVNLPAEFTGASSVMPGVNYTFTPKNENYTYKVTATIDGKEITVPANEDGSFTIDAKDITGNIVITSTKECKTFDVSLGEDMTHYSGTVEVEGVQKVQYMTDYTATLTKKSGSNYRVTVTIGGKNYTGFSSVDNSDGTETYTIHGEDITGDIVFNSHKSGQTQDMHSVQFKGEYGDIADNTVVEVENGTNYTLTINKLLGYKYTVTATMGGETATVTDNLDGTYTVANVTGDLVFTITKESDLAVDVKSYVTLNSKQMFLVTATASVDTGKVLSYNGNAMFFSKQYADPKVEGETGKWVYLVLTEGTLSADDAKAMITLTTGTKVELTQTYNVNETPNESVDINDAQLVYDMYNNKYQTIEEVTMKKFLNADVSGDMKIDVNDAVAVVEAILKTK